MDLEQQSKAKMIVCVQDTTRSGTPLDPSATVGQDAVIILDDEEAAFDFVVVQRRFRREWRGGNIA